MVFLVFIGFLYPPPVWKVFLLGQKSSPKDFLSVVVVYAFIFSADTDLSTLQLNTLGFQASFCFLKSWVQVH